MTTRLRQLKRGWKGMSRSTNKTCSGRTNWCLSAARRRLANIKRSWHAFTLCAYHIKIQKLYINCTNILVFLWQWTKNWKRTLFFVFCAIMHTTTILNYAARFLIYHFSAQSDATKAWQCISFFFLRAASGYDYENDDNHDNIYYNR